MRNHWFFSDLLSSTRSMSKQTVSPALARPATVEPSRITSPVAPVKKGGIPIWVQLVVLAVVAVILFLIIQGMEPGFTNPISSSNLKLLFAGSDDTANAEHETSTPPPVNPPDQPWTVINLQARCYLCRAPQCVGLFCILNSFKRWTYSTCYDEFFCWILNVRLKSLCNMQFWQSFVQCRA